MLRLAKINIKKLWRRISLNVIEMLGYSEYPLRYIITHIQPASRKKNVSFLHVLYSSWCLLSKIIFAPLFSATFGN